MKVNDTPKAIDLVPNLNLLKKISNQQRKGWGKGGGNFHKKPIFESRETIGKMRDSTITSKKNSEPKIHLRSLAESYFAPQRLLNSTVRPQC